MLGCIKSSGNNIPIGTGDMGIGLWREEYDRISKLQEETKLKVLGNWLQCLKAPT